MKKFNCWEKASAIVMVCAVTASAAAGQMLTTLATFHGANGASPGIEALMQGPNGSLYGTTSSGAHDAAGTIFELARGGALTTVYFFCSQTNCEDGIRPLS